MSGQSALPGHPTSGRTYDVNVGRAGRAGSRSRDASLSV